MCHVDTPSGFVNIARNECLRNLEVKQVKYNFSQLRQRNDTHPYPLQGGESDGIGIPSHGGVAAAAVVCGRGRGGSVADT
jgi:hypothetical protein